VSDVDVIVMSDVSVVMSDFDVSVVMSDFDFDVSVVMSDVDVNVALIVMSDVDVNAVLIVMSDVGVLGVGEGDYGDVHLQMNCWHHGKHILASIVYYFFSS
jgi:hypothetical protein